MGNTIEKAGGGGAGASAINGAMGTVNSIIDYQHQKQLAAQQYQYQESLNKNQSERNYKYNEGAANNADIRTRALWNDLYGPGALVRQYDANNLNPALMYGMGGGQGQSVSGAMGHGATGINAGAAPNMAAISQAGTAKGALALAAARTISEIKLMDSQANNVDKDTELKDTQKNVNAATVDNLEQQANKAAQEVNLLYEKTQNEKIIRDNLELQGEWQKIKNSQEPIRFEAEMKNIGEQTAWVISRTAGQDIENSMKEEQIRAQIDNFNANTKAQLANALWTNAQTSMTKEQEKLLDDYMILAWKEAGLTWYGNLEEGTTEYDLTMQDVEERIKKEVGWKRWNVASDITGSVGIAIGAIMGGAGSFIRNIFKGPATQPVQSTGKIGY